VSTADEKSQPAQPITRFLGHFELSLDDRGRLNLPARFRELLDDVVVISRGKERCLVGYSALEWERISVSLDALSITNDDNFRSLELLYAFSSDEEIDKQGRILIPANLRQYAEISNEVVVHGLNTRFVIWSKDNWNIEQRVLDKIGPDLVKRLEQHGVRL
jgi:MraZ protein